MGQRVIQFSDISGTELPEDEKMGVIFVEYGDARKGIYSLDATDTEIAELAGKGKRTSRGEVASMLNLDH